jgi:hypothetical protein
MDIPARTALAPCPGCRGGVSLGSEPREHQRLTCPHCGDYLEVINLEPPELDWAFDDFEPEWDPNEEERD